MSVSDSYSNQIVPSLMTTKEVADYLRIKERKVYDLVGRREIPCSRVGGKWLFPKSLIDLWVLENAETVGLPNMPMVPPIVGGSSDPLLEWALRSSGSGLATLFDGSLDGLQRFQKGEVMACGMHVPAPPLTATQNRYNAHLIEGTLAGQDTVLITLAWRTQGLLLPASNPDAIPQGALSLKALTQKGIPFMPRQKEAGAHVLLVNLLQEQGLAFEDLTIVRETARGESEVASAIVDGRARAGMAIAAVARRFGLTFIPLSEERFDILVRRRDYFEPPLQKLMGFMQTEAFKRRAEELGGYDLSDTGKVAFNGR